MSPNEPNRETVERRLVAVERALAEDEPVERAGRLDDLEARIAELEAAVQALRGYVGAVRAVNEDVEHRADLALRKAHALERNLPSDTEVAGNRDVEETETGETGSDGADSGGVLASLRR